MEENATISKRSAIMTFVCIGGMLIFPIALLLGEFPDKVMLGGLIMFMVFLGGTVFFSTPTVKPNLSSDETKEDEN